MIMPSHKKACTILREQSELMFTIDLATNATVVLHLSSLGVRFNTLCTENAETQSTRITNLFNHSVTSSFSVVVVVVVVIAGGAVGVGVGGDDA
jgi:hypothetical protein